MSFEQPPSPDPRNPEDVARIARKLLQKLAEQPDERSSVKDLYDRYFDCLVSEQIVTVAAKALVVHQQSPVACEGHELVLEEEHGVTDYCGLLDSSVPGDPLDLLEVYETYSDEVADLQFGGLVNTG